MSRCAFTIEFNRAMRFVIQKIDRVGEARAQAAELQKNNIFFEPREHLAVVEAENNLDAAIDQLADHLFDTFVAVVAPIPVVPVRSPSGETIQSSPAVLPTPAAGEREPTPSTHHG